MNYADACRPENCTFQAICSVCGNRFGEATKPDRSHGHCAPCARTWAEDQPEPFRSKLLAKLEKLEDKHA